MLSVTEVLNSSSALEGDEITVYGYAQQINGQDVLIAADLSGGSAAMHVNLERVSNGSEVVPGKVIYATGEVFNRNGSLTLAAKALEVRGKLWVPQEQEPAV